MGKKRRACKKHDGLRSDCIRLQGLQPAANAKGVHIIASLEQTGAPVNADSRRLQQVMWNLVHNAIKFTPKGGRVEIHVHRSDDELQIQGQGISRSFLPHVFERFRQQDSSATREASGLGLGLSIAKQIVELHGGTIKAMSGGEGQGAAFLVRVPTLTVRDATLKDIQIENDGPSGPFIVGLSP